ncbi:bifunctional pantoate--beta-alanine ligase/(d)CMP kinase [Prochlorococcus sp. MIT 1307]|uniref:bifunctional pantoate--beta-alanine ligase/(d)CMP kinase n=1 Tax=Prochlorococcus sp. MIT 1307 TaxID=3096219 RepID=UPI002A761FAE|nr:bifunctional pantoate--beta-alanine ligase/(d)CMP kinase [Prochlorococcus sp. MIT 1307]
MNFSVIRTQTELLNWRKQQESPVSFVPTMGGLHLGHEKLIKAAKSNYSNDAPSVLVSIFINPLQFGAEEDFNDYPRNLESDIETANQSGANAIWAPAINEIYPGGPEENFKVKVPTGLNSKLCGSIRKDHFDGVASVMLHLLRRIKPNLLVLGEKDWQQFVILRKLIKDLDLPIKIRGVATVRDFDGLAYSSRNQYLNHAEREQSLALPNELAQAAQDVLKGKKLNLQAMKSNLELKGLKVEYLDVVDPATLQATNPDKHFSLLAAAVRCGKTRLIDHTFLMTRKPIVAIDGPAGAGKSTVTKAFAEKLGLLYLDTGAMYRAVTWLIQQKGIDPKNQSAVAKSIENLKLEIEPFGKNPQIIINGNNVTEAIRSPIVTSLVSEIATQGSVREALTTQQKEIGKSGGLVAEGRDIGSAVFPNAELKVFLTASASERARRRVIDLQNQGYSIPSLNELAAQIKMRDQMDISRKISPLVKAKDAKEVVTDGMQIEAVIEKIEELFRLVVPEEVWPTPSK